MEYGIDRVVDKTIEGWTRFRLETGAEDVNTLKSVYEYVKGADGIVQAVSGPSHDKRTGARPAARS